MSFQTICVYMYSRLCHFTKRHISNWSVLDLSQSLEEEKSAMEHVSKHHDKHHETMLQGGRIIKNTRYAPPRYVNTQSFTNNNILKHIWWNL